jgi:hypothetical protein
VISIDRGVGRICCGGVGKSAVDRAMVEMMKMSMA